MTTTSTIVAGMLQFLHPLFFDTNIEVNRAEIECLATNIYFEAAAEGRLGKTAVAHVTLNRLHDPAYEHSVCNVVVESFAPGTKSCQFSWTCDGKPDEVPVDTRAGTRTYEDCVEEAIFAYFGLTKDPTGGATYYYAFNLVDPKWAHTGKIKETVVIGNHRFMADRDDIRRHNNPVVSLLVQASYP